MDTSFPRLLEVFEQKGYDFLESKDKGYRVNIVGWRNPKGRINRFDDIITVTYQDEKLVWWHHEFKATTKPGLPYLLKPIHPKGTAIMAPGQYKNAYFIGGFKGISVLRQGQPIRVYRDNNKDSSVDYIPDSIMEGNFGIHIHNAGWMSKIVGNWSAGCQVIAIRKEFDLMMQICRKSAKLYGNEFSYTLVGL